MSGAGQMMVRGFNDNVEYRGRRYHVQTEDSGRKNPHVFTHLFHGGTILSTKEAQYDHLLHVESWRDEVRTLMSRQHASMLNELLAGAHDEQITLVLTKLTATEPPPSSRSTSLVFDEAAISERDFNAVLLEQVAGRMDSNIPPSSRVPNSVACAVPSEPPRSLEGLTVDTRIRPENVFPVLDVIEKLPAGASGALLYRKAGQHAGMVLVDAGRVCWAVAERMQSRLTDILRKLTRPALEAQVFEEVFVRCHKQNTPFGEALVAAGLVTPETLRRALRQHSAEALVRLAMMAGETASVFTAHQRLSYNARYTFTTPELLTTACELRNKKLASAARAELRRVLPPEAGGIVFARCDDQEPLPVALQGTEVTSVMMVADLARFCCCAQDVTGILVRERKMVVHAVGQHAVVTWTRGPLAALALCAEPASLSYLYATILRPG